MLQDWVHMAALPRHDAPALFLDRDGTVINNAPYLADPAGVTLIPGAREAIAAFRMAGYAVVVVTNQSGVARGFYGLEQYRAVTARFLDQVGVDLIDAIYACPFHPQGQAPFDSDHPWRKPEAGMLLDAAMRLRIDLAGSVMVGDSLCDIEAGARAGAGRLVHTLTGHGAAERPQVEAFAATLKAMPDSAELCYVSTVGELTASLRCIKSSKVNQARTTASPNEYMGH
jgi:D-glycero-D-manno-heptose 1,7-bisphosphate phosphatase